MIRVYTQRVLGEQWLERHQSRLPLYACVLGFTATGLVPGISTAGAQPSDRQYTAIADGEFLVNGPQPQPCHPLPPLQVGASPVFISRAVIVAQGLPIYLFNAGLPQPPAVPAIDLGGSPAACLSNGLALPISTVEHLLRQGLRWGVSLANQASRSYLILGECVVGGTSTALAVLTGLGFAAAGKVNSSHPVCNHAQKWQLVQKGLSFAGYNHPHPSGNVDPLSLVAAIGDPMQVVVAAMAIAASRTCGVLLAGGTQMLAVYALLRAIAREYALDWQPDQVVVGTTRWVTEDRTGDTVGLAEAVGDVPLLATQLNFATSRYAALQAYEQGYVKEGVGAGGCAIAAHLYQGWSQTQLLQAIESTVSQHQAASDARAAKHHVF